MGYTHYWYRDQKLDAEKFQLVVADFKKTLPTLEHMGVRLANGIGEGLPILDSAEIIFNGPAKCGHSERDLGITWPSPTAKGVAPLSMQHRNGNNTMESVDGSWFAGAQLNSRTCGGDCSHETFYLPQHLDPVHTGRDGSTWTDQTNENGKYFAFCKTAYKPYDLAVNLVLIIASHYLGDQIVVSSDGELKDWQDAMLIAQHFLGYGNDFRLRD